MKKRTAETRNVYCDSEQEDLNNPVITTAMQRAIEKEVTKRIKHRMAIEQQRVKNAIEARGSWNVGESEYRANVAILAVLHERLESLNFPFPKHVARNSVTAFTKWIYALYQKGLGAYPNSSKLDRGLAVERRVLKHKRNVKKTAKFIRYEPHSQWRCIYVGMGDENSESLRIGALTVGGEPLWGKPDLVFRNVASGEIAIHEIKCSDADIPSDGWPNLQAQLWAYSKADLFRSASSIRLIGEVWSASDVAVPSLRAKFEWPAESEQMTRSCEQLFRKYGGKIDGASV